MQVRLIAVTKGVAEATTGQELISYVARVSNPNNQTNFDSAPRLIEYLIKHNHWSPFEHAYMTVEIRTSRAIAAQILRHRSFTFQEFSQRYAEALEMETYTARRQDIKNRQNSIDDMPEDSKSWFQNAQGIIWESSYRLYKEALALGIAKEQARFLLPLNTATVMYMTGGVRNWIHYINLRADASTQKEHRDIALSIKAIFCQEYPDIGAALNWTHAA